MKRIIESAADLEPEVIRQVKEYIEHCKKFDASCTTGECIQYIADNVYSTYEEIEDEFGALITDMMHIFTRKEPTVEDRLQNNDTFDYEADLQAESVNGKGKFRKCKKCGQVITGKDDCDFTNKKECICSACAKKQDKQRSHGNKFLEAKAFLESHGYELVK